VRRVRIAVVLLALALALPLALLVSRAVRSVALERDARHRVVAERVFDEMERALSTFLQQEEARPFEGWADVEPSTPFALGYFQLAPDGAALAQRANRRQGLRLELDVGVAAREVVHDVDLVTAIGQVE